MYPHERSLVKEMENKPFVLLGVNSDTDRAKIKVATPPAHQASSASGSPPSTKAKDHSRTEPSDK